MRQPGEYAKKSVAVGRWGTACRGCCDKCYALISCKFACTKLAKKIARLKKEEQDSKAAAQQEKENKEKPKIDQIKAIWSRLRVALERAGMDFDALCEAMDVSAAYLRSNAKAQDMLDGKAEKVTTLSRLPYNWSSYLSDFQGIIAAADALGCSVDYLLLRTDEPNPQAAPNEGTSAGWHTGNPDTPGEYVGVTDWGRGHESPERLRWTQEGWSKNGFVLRDVMPEVNVKAWIEVPTSSPPNNSCITGMSNSGQCGAAAFCEKDATCCMQCDEDCTARCGWIDTDLESRN